MPKKYLKVIYLAILFILIIIAALWYGHHRTIYPTTDDAYIQANIINMAAQVSGPISAIAVQDHQHVKKGQLLFQILQTNYQAAVEQMTAQEWQAEKQAKRILALAKQGNASQSEADIASENLKVAQANLAQAQQNLDFTTVTAPADGYITNFTLRVGSTVNPGAILFYIVEDAQWWVDANYKETQLGRVKPGQPADIILDMYPDHVFHGIVYQISAGSGASFSLLPPENATGNWVKVVQRFPVKIFITDPNVQYPLRVGASANVTIDTTRLIVAPATAKSS